MNISLVISVLRALTFLKHEKIPLYSFLPGSGCYFVRNTFLPFGRLCWFWLRVILDLKIGQTSATHSKTRCLNHLSEMKPRYQYGHPWPNAVTLHHAHVQIGLHIDCDVVRTLTLRAFRTYPLLNLIAPSAYSKLSDLLFVGGLVATSGGSCLLKNVMVDFDFFNFAFILEQY
jgi:hypothetical protein